MAAIFTDAFNVTVWLVFYLERWQATWRKNTMHIWLWGLELFLVYVMLIILFELIALS